MFLRLLLALLSGLLLALLAPPFQLRLLAPIALVPLCTALGHEFRPWGRFSLGFASGLVLWAATCWWIALVLDVHGGMGFWGGWGSFVLFCILKSIHYGVFSLLAGVLLRHWYGPVAIAFVWAVLERLQEPLTLFGWLMLGDAGIDMGLPARLAPITGVHGISFLFALTAACFAGVILRYPRKFALWGLLIVTPLGLPPLPTRELVQAHAAVVQPNIDPAGEWTATIYAGTKTTLALLSADAVREGPVDVVLWPESPGPMFFESDRDLQVRAGETAGTAKAPLLLSSISRDRAGQPRNSAFLVNAKAEAERRYDKMYLVPFGEYVPWPFGFVNQVSDEVGTYMPGAQRVLMPIAANTAGVFICYEAAVGPHVREFARAGASVFFNLSNDGYFFHTPAREQHLQLVRMRAAENRRWIVRSTNNGITAVVDPAGVVRETMPSFTARGQRMGYGYVAEQTFYTRFGDWFLWLGAAVALVCLAASQWPHYTTPKKVIAGLQSK